MSGYLPDGCTQQMCDEAQPGYYDEPEEDGPVTELDFAHEELARLQGELKATKGALYDAFNEMSNSFFDRPGKHTDDAIAAVLGAINRIDALNLPEDDERPSPDVSLADGEDA